MGNMGWNEEVLIEPTGAADDPVRIQVLCLADVAGRTQRLAFSRTIDADSPAATANERDGALSVTVNVLNVATRRERHLGPDRKNDRQIAGKASTRYWMDSLPCLSNRR